MKKSIKETPSLQQNLIFIKSIIFYAFTLNMHLNYLKIIHCKKYVLKVLILDRIQLLN